LLVSGYSRFSNLDLSETKGLESIQHRTPSTLGTDTLIRSRGKIPEAFLKGCGLPDAWIDYLPSLLGSMLPIQFHSCFISYSSKDQAFAERLHAGLQAKGVRCWFAPHHLPIGAKIRPAIDETVRVYDKLLLVLSEHSIASQWVEQEVETALRREREQGEIVLFPVRLDDAVFSQKGGWAALVANTRYIGDFTGWEEPSRYTKGFARLLRDLKAGGTPSPNR
jgi:hypothetical protein